MTSTDDVRARRLGRALEEWLDALETLSNREPAEAARIAGEARDRLDLLLAAKSPAA